MKIENKQVILDAKEDFEFVSLVGYITKMGYGEMVLKVRDSKPYQITEIRKNILLKQDYLKDNNNYGG